MSSSCSQQLIPKWQGHEKSLLHCYLFLHCTCKVLLWWGLWECIAGNCTDLLEWKRWTSQWLAWLLSLACCNPGVATNHKKTVSCFLCIIIMWSNFNLLEKQLHSENSFPSNWSKSQELRYSKNQMNLGCKPLTVKKPEVLESL